MPVALRIGKRVGLRGRERSKHLANLRENQPFSRPLDARITFRSSCCRVGSGTPVFHASPTVKLVGKAWCDGSAHHQESMASPSARAVATVSPFTAAGGSQLRFLCRRPRHSGPIVQYPAQRNVSRSSRWSAAAAASASQAAPPLASAAPTRIRILGAGWAAVRPLQDFGFTATASQTVSLAGNLLVPWYKLNTYWYYGTTVAAVLR